MAKPDQGQSAAPSHDEVAVEICPRATSHRSRRRPGSLRGQIWMTPDFDVLPTDILATMEGEEG